MWSSSCFDFDRTRTLVKTACVGREWKAGKKDENRWIFRASDWSNEEITKKTKQWSTAGAVATEKELQFIAQVLVYVDSLERAFEKVSWNIQGYYWC
jgi:hypothetical protein